MSVEQVAEFKEVFMLFDKDEDGVITFPEVIMVMKSLGQRPSGMCLHDSLCAYTLSNKKTDYRP